MGKKILVIGSMNIDITVRLKSFPKVGETVLTKETRYDLGGKGANQACAAARMGGTVKMMGCVGNDDFGRRQIEALEKQGVDISGIRIVPGVPTGTAIVCVEECGDNFIIVEQGANLMCNEDYLQAARDAIRECDFLLVQMEIPQESLYWAIRYAHKQGKCVVLNPAPAPESIPDDIYAMTDYLTPNESELLKLTGQKIADSHVCQDKLWKGVQELLSKGVRTVIVTLGKDGCGVYNRERTEHFEGIPVEVADTTGAGDCFNGAFVAGLAQGMEESEAVQCAVYASALSVTQKGAQASLPAKQEVEKGLRELRWLRA